MLSSSKAELADMVRTLGNYGSERKYVFSHKGVNSRMDELDTAMMEAMYVLAGTITSSPSFSLPISM